MKSEALDGNFDSNGKKSCRLSKLKKRCKLLITLKDMTHMGIEEMIE